MEVPIDLPVFLSIKTSSDVIVRSGFVFFAGEFWPKASPASKSEKIEIIKIRFLFM